MGTANRHSQASAARGATLVEFTIVAGVFYMVLFAVIEFGRLLYTWNLLDEITRRGARLAAVCPYQDAGGIYARASFGGSLLGDFASANLAIDYLDANAAEVAPATQFSDIRFVRARVVDYQFQAFIPFLSLWLPAPGFETVLPSESLGVVPVNAGSVSC